MSSATPYRNAAKIDKLESLAVLEGGYGRDSTGTADGAAVVVDQRTHHDDEDEDDEDNEDARVARDKSGAPIALDVSIRRGRLTLVTLVAVAVILALTVVFYRGVRLAQFDASDKSTEQQTKLLDDYNSYTGNVSSVFAKPIEVFVTLAVQVLLLRFLVAATQRPELSWKVAAATIVLSAALSFLVSNSFNAVNVQLRALEVEPVVSFSDLSVQAADAGNDVPAELRRAILAGANDTASTAADMRTTAETGRMNPSTNTVLRSLLMPPVRKVLPTCSRQALRATTTGGIPETTVQFGLLARDWQKRVLPYALEAKQLRVVMNATAKTGDIAREAANLPMNASRAADLFMYAMMLGNHRLPWAIKAGTFLNSNASRYPGTPTTDRLTNMVGLLPSDADRVSETARRESLLRNMDTWLPERLDNEFVSRADVPVTFSSVDVSPSIRFDAVTLELEVKQSVITNKTSVGDAEVPRTNFCGPWPGLCTVNKTALLTGNSQIAFDTPPQVAVARVCLNSNGDDTLRAKWATNGYLSQLDCPRGANASMLVLSVGKRLVADSITQNATIDGTPRDTETALVQNLRKIYSYTVGILSWQVEDLAAAYHASCNDTATACRGLDFSLSPSNAPVRIGEKIVVAADAIKVASLPLPVEVVDKDVRMLPLVTVNELPQNAKLEVFEQTYRPAAGDPLFLHNIGSVQWPNTTVAPCNIEVEDRLFLAVKNHIYMESSLQPAYTAATFFLFENALVKDVERLDFTRVTLAFDRNVKHVALWASVPARNAWLTLAGCIALVLALGGVLFAAVCRPRATTTTQAAPPQAGGGGGGGEIKEPHVIARVLLDEQQFPPLVLHRRVVRTTTAAAGAQRDVLRADEFKINGLSLQRQLPPNAGEQAKRVGDGAKP